MGVFTFSTVDGETLVLLPPPTYTLSHTKVADHGLNRPFIFSQEALDDKTVSVCSERALGVHPP